MSEVKFLDKKKVVVVGKINSTETLVQEIYIVNGAELPQGENFVVKTNQLKDVVAETWEENQIKKIKKEYEHETTRYRDRISELNREHKRISSVVRRKLEALKKLDKNFDKKEFDVFINFITGKYKYIVENRYGRYNIIGFNTAIHSDERCDSFELRLLSFFGRPDGTISTKMCEYSDGSGGTTNIYPFKNKQDAIAFIAESINKLSEIGPSVIESAKAYGIKISEEKLAAYKAKSIAGLQGRIDDAKKNLEKAEAALKEELAK